MLPGDADRYVKASPRKAATVARQRATSVVESDRATSAELFAALDRASRCRRCGTHIEDPASVARGLGPECAGKEEHGVGRLRSLRRAPGGSAFVEVQLTVNGEVVAGVADTRRSPFVELFAQGVSAASYAFVDVDVAYQLDVIRNAEGVVRTRLFTSLRPATATESAAARAAAAASSPSPPTPTTPPGSSAATGSPDRVAANAVALTTNLRNSFVGLSSLAA